MPLTIQSQTQSVSIDRLTYRSGISFETAEARLRTSIQKVQSQSQSSVSALPTSGPRPTSKESFEATLIPQLGPHGFKYFAEFNHGSWLSLYKPPTSTITISTTTTRGLEGTSSGTAATKTQTKELNLRAIRFILGNPLIALTMLRHDLDAGLCVPVELYLVEELAPDAQGEAGVRIVWYRPSGLVAGYEGAPRELVDAARALDAKLEALVRWVLDEQEVVGVGKL